MKRKNDELAINQNITSLNEFLENYNKNIPPGYLHASVKSLKRFQTVYPALFKNGDEWSVDKHRKKLMDWLTSHSDNS